LNNHRIKTEVPGLKEKVAFLSDPAVYPVPSARVEAKETHRSWVFLTEAHAWKLKKPMRTDFLDFSTPEARHRNCEAEVRLNRRLAADVYYGLVPLLLTADHHLRLGGKGEVIDWLVKMRRLPAHRMLDQLIADHAILESDIESAAMLLARFYKHAIAIAITTEKYLERLAREICANRAALLQEPQAFAPDLVNRIADAQLQFLSSRAALLDARVHAGKIIEAHGDLRPEHICLVNPPAIIDCLEFNKEFRTMDSASELAFLALECKRLGASRVGEQFVATVCRETEDRPPDKLMHFYKSFHALLRAKIANWRLRESDETSKAKWIERAGSYLRLAASSNATIESPV
jgi:aminoglycoside phosphotransferase family enzyme